MVKVNKPLGNSITKENYQSLRNLATKLKMKDFVSACGFKSGVWDRLRRFPSFEKYKNNEKEKAIKYGYVNKKRNSERVTVNDVYSKLISIEKNIMKNNVDAKNRIYLLCEGPNAKAIGMQYKNSKGLEVVKNSKTRTKVLKSHNYSKLLNELLKKGVLKSDSKNPKSYIFTENYVFDSPSAASSIVLNRQSTGRGDWKTPSGISLKYL